MRLGFGLLAVVVLAVLVTALRGPAAEAPSPPPGPAPGDLRVYSDEARGYVVLPRVVLSDQEWRKRLSAMQYRVLRQQGTEAAFTGALWNNHQHGVYRCAACGNDLFRSEAKFESSTGWPSFFEPIAKENIETRVDRSLFMERTEVLCRRCGSHLGHVFPDGPKPTGLRYCMNSAALVFAPQPERR